MARGVNKVILLGRLGNDPDTRTTANGLQIARCSLATNKTWNDNQGQKQEQVEWHRVVFFNKLAGIASQYLKKGMQVYVEGELKTNSWEKDGVTRYTTEVIAREMQMLGERQDATTSSQYSNDEVPNYAGGRHNMENAPANKKSDKSGAPDNSYDELDQDIPF